ncbi:hypothetical protein HD554DRAFT_2174109 [Boletus coccyginus]|nr:hypothetical protein HD554DRAFT_2174109 [Boletus coccyginus]
MFALANNPCNAGQPYYACNQCRSWYCWGDELGNFTPPAANISNRFSIPPLTLKNNIVVSSDDISDDENINPNNMIFIIDKIMEPGKIVDLDQAMNSLQINSTLNNWLVMFPKNVHVLMRIQRHQTIFYRNNLMHQLVTYQNVPDLLIRQEVSLVQVDAANLLDVSSHLTQVIQTSTLYCGDILLQVVVEEDSVQYIPEQDVIFKEEFMYWNKPIVSFYEGLGYVFPMEKYHSTPAHPVHNQGFEIVQHNHHVISKYFIEFYESLKSNEVLDCNVQQELYEHPEHFINSEGDIIWKDGQHQYMHHKFNCLHSFVRYPHNSDIPMQCIWNELMDARWRRNSVEMSLILTAEDITSLDKTITKKNNNRL